MAASSSSKRMNSTLKPFSMARTPSAIAKCVLPTPGGPWIKSVSFSLSQVHVPSVSMRDLSTLGWKAKSKVAKVWPVGRPESRREVRMRRSSRKASSASNTVSKKARGLISSLTAAAVNSGSRSAA